MTPTEHALTVVAEEGGEVAAIALRASQAAHKALRFGMDDGYPGTDRTNRLDLVREVNDLIGSVEFLRDQGIELPGLFDRAAIDAKKAKIRTWMNYAAKQGRISAKAQGMPEQPFDLSGADESGSLR